MRRQQEENHYEEKEEKKKIIIGAAVVLVAAGGISVAAQRKSGEDQIPQVPVVTVQTGDVEEIVDASGTVGSEEEKNLAVFSPKPKMNPRWISVRG